MGWLGEQGHPEIGAAFCRHGYLDAAGDQTSVAEPVRPTEGILEGWLETIAVRQRIECPSIVVGRAAYEHLGGFTPELRFVEDESFAEAEKIETILKSPEVQRDLAASHDGEEED